MDPGTRNAALIAAIAILAVGVSAATLSSTTQDSDGSGSGGGGFGPEPGFPEVDPPEQADTGSAPLFSKVLAALLLLSALAALVYAVLYSRGVVALLGLLALAAVIIWLLFQLVDLFGGGPGGFGLGGGPGGFGGGESSTETDVQTFSLLGLFVVGSLAVLGIYLFRSSDSADPPADPSEPDQADQTAAAVGAIAGRAADRIESNAETDSIDNQVYRAYREMTDQLDVDHGASTTPKEFADAAAARGLAPDDVAALTALFEEVRYGGFDPTADREDEATETLRRIERRYADE